MMETKFLKWDSDFFKRRMGAVRVERAWGEKELKWAEKEGFEPLVIFSEVEQPILDRPWNYRELRLTFAKTVSLREVKHLNIHVPLKSSSRLLEIFLQSGRFSRFRLDSVLRPYFKTLYSRWLENAIAGKFDDFIFCTVDGDQPTGVVTLKKVEGYLQLGIIAVAEGYRGRGIGGELIAFAEDKAIELGYHELRVVTQAQNVGAIAFYENNGLREIKREWVYHVYWENK